MSSELISRSPDLTRLRRDGYQVDVVENHLLMKHVPYVTPNGVIGYGVLVSTLAQAGDRTARPDTHVAWFIGEQPCDKRGSVIAGIKHSEGNRELCTGIVVNRKFSCKPPEGYRDYYEKMTTYANILAGPAEAIDPHVTAKTHIIETTEEATAFEYADTATSRAGIGPITRRLVGHKVAIVGLGGTGSYVLDMVAKTPVEEIHLFDGDQFNQHNAFRSPGAPTLDELRQLPLKVEYFHRIYGRMHKGIRPHAHYVDAGTAQALSAVDFVFLCVDSGRARGELLAILHDMDKPFIDVGMSVELVQGKDTLVGMVRVSTSAPGRRKGEVHISQGDASSDEDDAYADNIQVADLNCLNAAMAVIKWKKMCEFYQDLEGEHLSIYSTNANHLASEVPD